MIDEDVPADILDAQKRLLSVVSMMVDIMKSIRTKINNFKDEETEAQQVRQYADDLMDLLLQMKKIA